MFQFYKINENYSLMIYLIQIFQYKMNNINFYRLIGLILKALRLIFFSLYFFIKSCNNFIKNIKKEIAIFEFI